MANLEIGWPIQDKPVDQNAHGPFDLATPKAEPHWIGPSKLGSERNGKRIDQMTLDDYRRGVQKVFEASQVTSRA